MLGLKLTSGSGIVDFVGPEDVDEQCIVQIGKEKPYIVTIREDEEGFIEKMMSKCSNITSDSLEEEEEKHSDDPLD